MSKCLAKDPNDRYANVLALIQVLELMSDLEDPTIVVKIEASIPPQPPIQETKSDILTEGISEQAMNRYPTPVFM